MKLLQNEPFDADRWCERGNYHFKKGCLTEAEEAYRTALKYEFNHANAWFHLG
ncbi:MAG: tetratricopeptide repeat protein, partial [Candidatus Hodarchaeales archaeon]